MPRSSAPSGPLPTLNHLVEQAFDIDAECRTCRHKIVLRCERFLDSYGDMPFPDFSRLLKCSACCSRPCGRAAGVAIAHIEKPRRGERGLEFRPGGLGLDARPLPFPIERRTAN